MSVLVQEIQSFNPKLVYKSPTAPARENIVRNNYRD
jgi:hypothetical protein